MAFALGRSTAILYGAHDVAGFFRDYDLPGEVDVEDSTTFGQTAKTYQPTLSGATLSLNGLWDGDPDAIDEILEGALAGPALPLTLGPDGLGLNAKAKLLATHETKSQTKGAIGGLVEVSAEFLANGIPAHGQVYAEPASRASTANGTTVDHAAGVTAAVVAHLHVLVGSGTLTAKVQHSTNASAWADLVTFTAASGPTAERVVVPSGTVNRYLRATWTISGGPFTFAVAAARVQ